MAVTGAKLQAMSVADGLANVRERIAAACKRVDRDATEVRLVAVSKGHGADAIRSAYALGQREFGENYVQELVAKAAALAELSDLRLRFIGHLQRNKVKDVVPVASAVDCVDSLRLAQALSQHAQTFGRSVPVLLQVNVDREPQKSGALPEAVPELVAAVRDLPLLRLDGLMAIPRATEDSQQARPSFRTLRDLAHALGLRELSMGMSHDFEIAIEEGATLVRVGTAIFGPRSA